MNTTLMTWDVCGAHCDIKVSRIQDLEQSARMKVVQVFSGKRFSLHYLCMYDSYFLNNTREHTLHSDYGYK